MFSPDVNTSVPDKKSVMMYVMCLFQSLPHASVEVTNLDFLQSDTGSSLASPLPEVCVGLTEFIMYGRDVCLYMSISAISVSCKQIVRGI